MTGQPAAATEAAASGGVRPIPKRRTLRIAACADRLALYDLCQQLQGMKGVTTLRAVGAALLTVEYDLRVVSFARIEGVLADFGVELEAGLHGYLRAWWRFTEQNELANASYTPSPCCNWPPPRGR